jgi:hypothetical protein
MNRALIGLLALSLAGNVTLYWLTHRQSQPPVAIVASTPAVPQKTASVEATASSIDPTATAKPMIWRRANGAEGLKNLAADLRAAGFPSRAINAAISTAFNELRNAEDPAFQGPFWQKYALETRAAQTAYAREGKSMLEAILGPDARLSAQLSPVERQKRYGNLSDEKIDALKQVERDYQELQQDVSTATFSRNPSQADYATYEQKNQLLKQEIASDLSSVLTPAEKEAYDLRNSDSARQLSSAVRDLDLSEEEFTALYRVQKSYDEANPRRFNFNVTSAEMEKRQTDQQAMLAQTKNVLGDTRFYQYLGATDANYREITRLSTQYPTVTPQTAYQVTQLQQEAQQLLRSLSRTNQTSSRDYVATIAALNGRLESLVGPEAAALIRKQNSGRIFNQPAITSRAPAAPRN